MHNLTVFKEPLTFPTPAARRRKAFPVFSLPSYWKLLHPDTLCGQQRPAEVTVSGLSVPGGLEIKVFGLKGLMSPSFSFFLLAPQQSL